MNNNDLETLTDKYLTGSIEEEELLLLYDLLADRPKKMQELRATKVQLFRLRMLAARQGNEQFVSRSQRKQSSLLVAASADEEEPENNSQEDQKSEDGEDKNKDSAEE